MMNSLSTPMHLSDRLGLMPSREQQGVMDAFADGVQELNVAQGTDNEIFRAIAVSALWRLLTVEVSRVSVIADTKRRGKDFMGFLRELTTRVDPALSAVCRWSSWRALEIGQNPQHTMRFYSNLPELFQGSALTIHTVVVLGAGNSDTGFVGAQKALESSLVDPEDRILRLW